MKLSKLLRSILLIFLFGSLFNNECAKASDVLRYTLEEIIFRANWHSDSAMLRCDDNSISVKVQIENLTYRPIELDLTKFSGSCEKKPIHYSILFKHPDVEILEYPFLAITYDEKVLIPGKSI